MAQASGSNMAGCAIIGIVILAAIGSCLPKGDQTAATGNARWVTAGSLNCRSEDRLDAAVIRQHRKDERVTIAEERGDWARTEEGCWVAARYLAAALAEPSTGTANSATAQGLMASPLSGSANPAGRGSSGESNFGGSSGSGSGERRSAYASGSGSYGSSKPSTSRKSSARKKTTYKKRSSTKRKKKRSSGGYSSGNCPCSGYNVCIGPRGGRYCITSGGNKRYGV